jgi:hypothetical protein
MEPKRLSYSGLVKYSIQFFGAHFVFVFGAGLIAAFGRSIQLGALGEISGGLNTLLEIIIESARILTFLLVIGEGSIGKGVNRIKNLFRLNWSQWKSIYSIVITRMKANWIALVINLLIYSVIAFIINFIIDKVAYDTELLTTLHNSNILAPNTTEWVLLLFFKNLTVIPFTLIFNGNVFLWVTDTLQAEGRKQGMIVQK